MIVTKETIEWIDVLDDMPDDSINLLIVVRDENAIDTLVWSGYWDSADNCWRISDGNQIDDVIYWADMPGGPAQ